MKTIKKIIFGILAAGVLATAGCMRDEGSYDYRTVNKVTIAALNDAQGEAIGEEIVATATSTLSLTPVMSESLPEAGDEYTYRWYIYPQGISKVEYITISEERDLEWPVTAAPAEYTVVFVVTNTETEVSSRYEFFMRVVAQNVGTLMVASNIDGAADLTARNPAGEWVSDIYGIANGRPAAGSAVWVADARMFQTESVNNSVFLTSEGGAFFNNNSFRDVEAYREMFYDAPAVIAPQAYYRGYSYYGYSDELEFLINDGRLHYRIATLVAGGAKFTSDFEGDYSMHPCAMVHNGNYLFYDNRNMRFRLATAEIYDMFEEYTIRLRPAYMYESYGYDPTVIAAFDPDAVGLEMIWFGAAYFNREDLGYALMRDPADRNRLWRLKFFAAGLGYIGYSGANMWYSYFKEPVAAQNEIADAVSFTMARNNPYIYYGAGSKVYLYNVENDNNREILDVGTIVPGAEVDHVYIQNAGMNRNDSDLNYRLYIAVSPVGGVGRCGSVIEARLMPNGEYESHVLHSEVVGKVVSMDYQM